MTNITKMLNMVTLAIKQPPNIVARAAYHSALYTTVMLHVNFSHLSYSDVSKNSWKGNIEKTWDNFLSFRWYGFQIYFSLQEKVLWMAVVACLQLLVPIKLGHCHSKGHYE